MRLRRDGARVLAVGGFVLGFLGLAVAPVAADFQSGLIVTVAGGGGTLGDGGQARDGELLAPNQVKLISGGGYLIADTTDQRIRKVSKAGVIQTIAGNGTAGFTGDHAAATSAELKNPAGVAPGPDNTLLIADTDNNRIREITASGKIKTIAGNGTPGSAGDNGPAKDAELQQPTAVAPLPGAGYLIADYQNHCIRKVNSAGKITTVAGQCGGNGFGGDNGPATAAMLFHPADVAPTADGGYLIADTDNHVIRKVSKSGTIKTVAGTGTMSGSSGDGGAPTSAKLTFPTGISPTSGKGFLIADFANNEIRRVSDDGTVIERVAGTGTIGFTGDGSAAIDAKLHGPKGVAATHDGGFLIADTGNNRVRFVLG